MTQKPEHEYVEYQIDLDNGVVTDCRFFGKGKQTEPLDEIKIYKPADQPPNIHFDRWLERYGKRLKMIFTGR